MKGSIGISYKSRFFFQFRNDADVVWCFCISIFHFLHRGMGEYLTMLFEPLVMLQKHATRTIARQESMNIPYYCFNTTTIFYVQSVLISTFKTIPFTNGRGCDSANAARCCVAWKKFRKLLPVLTTGHLSPYAARCSRHTIWHMTWCDMIWHDMMWCDVTWRDMLFNVILCYSILWYDMIKKMI